MTIQVLTVEKFLMALINDGPIWSFLFCTYTKSHLCV